VVNSEEWVALALETGHEAGFDARRIAANPIGEDFAFYQQRLPGAFIMIGSGGPYALHHPQFRVDDAALFPTAQWLAKLAVQALKKAAA
jgi:metal-dependent amidase/aminoacylase/carboxypeptidase family protein